MFPVELKHSVYWHPPYIPLETACVPTYLVAHTQVVGLGPVVVDIHWLVWCFHCFYCSEVKLSSWSKLFNFDFVIPSLLIKQMCSTCGGYLFSMVSCGLVSMWSPDPEDGSLLPGSASHTYHSAPCPAACWYLFSPIINTYSAPFFKKGGYWRSSRNFNIFPELFKVSFCASSFALCPSDPHFFAEILFLFW